MAKKNISELSSDELYRLAQEREQQEAAAAKEAVRAQIEVAAAAAESVHPHPGMSLARCSISSARPKRSLPRR